MAMIKSNEAINPDFFKRASETFRRMAGRTPSPGTAAAYKSGLQKFGSAIAAEDYEGTKSMMEQMLKRGKELGR